MRRSVWKSVLLMLAIAAFALVTPGAAAAAVTLVAFNAFPSLTAVQLRWETASEPDTLGFYILRSSSEGGTYDRISELISTQGDSIAGAQYSYTDGTVTVGTTYYYRLEIMDINQQSEYYGPVSGTPGYNPLPLTNTPTSTNTFTPTATATITRTATVTATRTLTPTASVSSSSTVTATKTPTLRYSSGGSTYRSATSPAPSATAPFVPPQFATQVGPTATETFFLPSIAPSLTPTPRPEPDGKGTLVIVQILVGFIFLAVSFGIGFTIWWVLFKKSK